MEQIDEDVIKIEYFDTNSVDPLKEESPYDEVVILPNNEKCTQIDKNNCVEDDFIERSDNEGQSTKEEDFKTQTWYKEIDESGKYTCKYCTLAYYTVQTLRRHVLTKHKSEANRLKLEMIKNKRKSKFKCHICLKYCSGILDLKEHKKRMHHKDDSYRRCHKCQAMFENDSQMSAHLLAKHNVHYNKMYVCNDCGYRTSKISHYKQHEATHLNKKSNKCKMCDYATNNMSNLKIHERIHSDLRPYACTFEGCDYRAVARSALRSHLLKHKPEENMLYCAKCPYKTVYKQCLKKHTDSHNRNTARIIL